VALEEMIVFFARVVGLVVVVIGRSLQILAGSGKQRLLAI
jgi:hypothetical protein